MSIFTEPKIDSHCHVLDPARFPYNPQVAYHPAGQEMGNADYFRHVMDCYHVKHALLVGPNSGYATDNRCLLDAIARSAGAFKGIAVVANDCPLHELQDLKAQGVVGVAFNPSLMGFDFYAGIEPLLERLRQLDLWAQFQVEGDGLLPFLPMLSRVGVRMMVDHCGRPLRTGTATIDIQSKGFEALLALGREGRAVVKLSGMAKFSQTGFPFDDVRPCVDALVRHFGWDHCIWASDWPYLKAPYRLDYGPMLRLYERWFAPHERERIMWSTPQRLFGFGGAA